MRPTPIILGLFFLAVFSQSSSAGEAYVSQALGSNAQQALKGALHTAAVPIAIASAAKPAAGGGVLSDLGGANVSLISQTGSQNSAMLAQVGGGNLSYIIQQGSQNSAIVSQRR
jgi:hypothetical protein